MKKGTLFLISIQIFFAAFAQINTKESIDLFCFQREYYTDSMKAKSLLANNFFQKDLSNEMFQIIFPENNLLEPSKGNSPYFGFLKNNFPDSIEISECDGMIMKGNFLLRLKENDIKSVQLGKIDCWVGCKSFFIKPGEILIFLLYINREISMSSIKGKLRLEIKGISFFSNEAAFDISKAN